MNNKDELIRQEQTINAQGRVNIIELADLAIALKERGIMFSNMSSLLDVIVQTAHWACKQSGYLPWEHEGVSHALNTLKSNGLIQRSLYHRSKKKLETAIAFENLREEGINPLDYVPNQFNVMHNSSAKSGGKIDISKDKTDEMVETYKRLEREKLAGHKKRGLNSEELKDLMNPDHDPEVEMKEKAEGYSRQLKAKEMLDRIRGEGLVDKDSESKTAAALTEEEIAEEEARIKAKDEVLMEKLGGCKVE